MKKDLISLLAQAKDWGVNLVRTPQAMSQRRALEVYRKTEACLELIGHLSWEQDEYVFRYNDEYTGKAISAFPNVGVVYRSKYLWPFFAVRIPPLDREDVRQEIASRSLAEDQTLEILGSVAKVSVSNPYEFKLVS